MNEELQKALADFVTLLIDGVKSGATFAQQQLPAIIQENILYARIDYTFWALVGLLSTLTAIYLVVGAVKAAKIPNEGSYYTVWSTQKTYEFWIRLGPAIPFAAAGLVVLLATLDNVFLVWFAPRVFILEWLRTFVK